MPHQSLPPVGSRRLVIVEDEGILALDIERHLRSRGYEVAGVAADAVEAVNLVAEQRPDLVLMDIRIQGEVDGIETARRIKERFEIPVVFLTAHSDPGTIERANATAPLGYLLKPFKKPDLENMVGIALRRSQLERALRQREALLSSTLECIDEAVLTASEDGRITWANAAAAELARRPPLELVNRPLDSALELRTRGAALQQLLEEARAAGRTRIEGDVVWPAETRSVVGTAAVVRDGSASRSYVVALRDLSDMLRARKQAEFTERLATLGTLAAGVAHEVNNPLSVITASLDTLAQHATGDSLEVIADATDAAQRVATIISELLLFGRPQSERSDALRLEGCLRSALRLTRSSRGHDCPVTLELDDSPAVQGSALRLTQVLVSLLINASQAMRSTKSGQKALELRVSTAPDGSAVVAVSDTGPGVPGELHERVFDPFFTTKSAGEGTGLGLAIARSIVRNHGGELSCAARADGQPGACFTLHLPASPTRVTAALRVAWLGPSHPALTAMQQTAEIELVEAIAQPHVRLQPLDVDLVIAPTLADLRAAFPDGNTPGTACVLSDETPPTGVLRLRRFSPAALLGLAGRPKR